MVEHLIKYKSEKKFLLIFMHREDNLFNFAMCFSWY